MTPEQFAQALTEKFAGPEFEFYHRHFAVDPRGQRWIRITQEDPDHEWSKSVHCFVDEDGAVYKADGWKRPAKGMRFLSMEAALEAADSPAGGYLYRRH